MAPSLQDPNTHRSSFREKLLEHLFVGELLTHSWKEADCDLEVSRPDVDDSGYDLILEARGVLRHVQLKTSGGASKTAQQKVQLALAKKPSGCVVWIRFDPRSLALGPFGFFGQQAGQPMGDLDDLKVAKHSKANADGVKLERPNLRIVPKGRFETIHTIPDLYELLFGPAPEPASID
ncbi:MAG: hypothetical protein P1V81_13250 [Planctomycetota bacterium]|nr:hypothetical protein [Planctomycetota bacterium]